MNKKDLIIATAKCTGVSKEATALIIDTFISSIKEAVERGEAVNINGFCRVQMAHFKETTRHNVYEGCNITVPAARVPRFYTSKKWKEVINGKDLQ